MPWDGRLRCGGVLCRGFSVASDISAVKESNCYLVLCGIALTGMAIIYSFMGLIVERCVATARYRTYGQSKSVVAVLLLLVVPVKEDFVLSKNALAQVLFRSNTSHGLGEKSLESVVRKLSAVQ